MGVDQQVPAPGPPCSQTMRARFSSLVGVLRGTTGGQAGCCVRARSLASLADRVRGGFPALNVAAAPVREHPVYVDGPGGTQVHGTVVEAMADVLINMNANLGYGSETSVKIEKVITSSRQSMANLLNAAPEEIVFANNMTTAALHLSHAL